MNKKVSELAAEASMEASFSNALKSLLVILVILFLALTVKSEGLIFSSKSNVFACRFVFMDCV